jgi:hypothetical protein
MHESLSVFAWALGGTLAFALLGALFGGLANWLAWRSGQSTGTALGRRVAEALGRLRADEPTPGVRAVLTGAADGALFLGLVGALLGVVVRLTDLSPGAWLVPLFGSAVALAGAAVFFGLLAQGIVRQRTAGTLGLFVGGIGGALLTARYAGVAHIVPGAVAGLVLGTLAGLMVSGDR